MGPSELESTDFLKRLVISKILKGITPGESPSHNGVTRPSSSSHQKYGEKKRSSPWDVEKEREYVKMSRLGSEKVPSADERDVPASSPGDLVPEVFPRIPQILIGSLPVSSAEFEEMFPYFDRFFVDRQTPD